MAFRFMHRERFVVGGEGRGESEEEEDSIFLFCLREDV